MRQQALDTLGWLVVTTVMEGCDREEVVTEKWFKGAAFHIPLGRSPCVEVLTACWRRGKAEFSTEPDRFDYGKDELKPEKFGEIGFDDPKRLDFNLAVDFIWRRVYQDVYGERVQGRIAPAKIMDLRAWLDRQLKMNRRRLRLVIDRHDINNDYNLDSTLKAIHEAIPQIHIIVIDSSLTSDPKVFVVSPSDLAAGIYDCLHLIKDLP